MQGLEVKVFYRASNLYIALEGWSEKLPQFLVRRLGVLFKSCFNNAVAASSSLMSTEAVRIEVLLKKKTSCLYLHQLVNEGGR